MICLGDIEMSTAPAETLRQARKDAEVIMQRLRAAYLCGIVSRRTDLDDARRILEFFADMPGRPASYAEILADAVLALCDPYDETTEPKVERAYNYAAHQRERCTAELMRRREPLDPGLSSRFIF